MVIKVPGAVLGQGREPSGWAKFWDPYKSVLHCKVPVLGQARSCIRDCGPVLS